MGKQFYEIRELQPGDIIQFRDHVNKITTATSWATHKRPHHTAIVESVGPGPGEITVLEQHVQAGADDPNKKLEVVRRNKMYLQSGSFSGVGSVTVIGTALFFILLINKNKISDHVNKLFKYLVIRCHR